MGTKINPRERAALKAAIEDFELRRCGFEDFEFNRCGVLNSADLIITAKRIRKMDDMVVADITEYRGDENPVVKVDVKFPLSELTR